MVRLPESPPEYTHRGFKYLPTVSPKLDPANNCKVYIWDHKVYRVCELETAKQENTNCRIAMQSDSPPLRHMTEGEFKTFVNYMLKMEQH